MTNEEKASICSDCLADITKSCHNGCIFFESYKTMVWKDQQFKEYLEKKMAAKLQARESFEKGSDVWWDYTTSATAIEEIINELFKED